MTIDRMLLERLIFLSPDSGHFGEQESIPPPPSWLTEGLRLGAEFQEGSEIPPERLDNDSLDMSDPPFDQEPPSDQAPGPFDYGQQGPSGFPEQEGAQDPGPMIDDFNDYPDQQFAPQDSVNQGYDEAPYGDDEGAIGFGQEEPQGFGEENPYDDPGEQFYPEKDPQHPSNAGFANYQPGFDDPAPDFSRSHHDQVEQPGAPPGGYGAEAPPGFDESHTQPQYGTPPGYESQLQGDEYHRIEFEKSNTGTPPPAYDDQSVGYPMDQGSHYPPPQEQDPYAPPPEDYYDDQGYPQDDPYHQPIENDPFQGGGPPADYGTDLQGYHEPTPPPPDDAGYMEYEPESSDRYSGASNLRPPEQDADRFRTEKSDESVSMPSFEPPPGISDIPKVSLSGPLENAPNPEPPKPAGRGGQKLNGELSQEMSNTSDPSFEQLSIGALKRGEDGKIDLGTKEQDKEFEPLDMESLERETQRMKKEGPGAYKEKQREFDETAAAAKNAAPDWSTKAPQKKPPQTEPSCTPGSIRMYGAAVLVLTFSVMIISAIFGQLMTGMMVAAPALFSGLVMLSGASFFGWLGLLTSLAYAGLFGWAGAVLLGGGTQLADFVGEGPPASLPYVFFGLAGGIGLGSLIMFPVKLKIGRSTAGSALMMFSCILGLPILFLLVAAGSGGVLGRPDGGFAPQEISLGSATLEKPANWGQFPWSAIEGNLSMAGFFDGQPDHVFVNRREDLMVTITVEELNAPAARLAQFLRTRPASARETELTGGNTLSQTPDSTLNAGGIDFDQWIFERTVPTQEGSETAKTIFLKASMEERYLFLTATTTESSIAEEVDMEEALIEFAEGLSF